MRVFKTKAFDRFARRSSIGDPTLCDTVARAERGQVDADLGSGVVKQRVARAGQGKSGGFRTVIVFRAGDLPYSSTALPRACGTTSRRMN